MKITSPLRGRRPTKRLDLTDMRHLFRDTRMWCGVAIVTVPDEGGDHFELTETDVLVEVVLQPALIPITCRLSAALWRIPDVGEEVMVMIPDGAIEFMPTIIDVLSSRALPTSQGPALGRVVVIRGEVVVHDGSGGAVSLARKQDVINVDNKYAGHKHLSPSGATGGPLATTVPNPPNPAFPMSDPINPYLTVPGGVPTTNPDSPGLGLTAAEILGTSVLKGK